MYDKRKWWKLDRNDSVTIQRYIGGVENLHVQKKKICDMSSDNKI